LNSADVEITIEANREEAKALLEALKPEASSSGAPFSVSTSPRGITLVVRDGPLGEVRAYSNSLLRLLRAARESIRAVD